MQTTTTQNEANEITRYATARRERAAAKIRAALRAELVAELTPIIRRQIEAEIVHLLQDGYAAADEAALDRFEAHPAPAASPAPVASTHNEYTHENLDYLRWEMRQGRI